MLFFICNVTAQSSTTERKQYGFSSTFLGFLLNNSINSLELVAPVEQEQMLNMKYLSGFFWFLKTNYTLQLPRQIRLEPGIKNEWGDPARWNGETGSSEGKQLGETIAMQWCVQRGEHGLVVSFSPRAGVTHWPQLSMAALEDTHPNCALPSLLRATFSQGKDRVPKVLRSLKRSSWTPCIVRSLFFLLAASMTEMVRCRAEFFCVCRGN